MNENPPAESAATPGIGPIPPIAGPIARSLVGLVLLVSGFHKAAAPAEEFAVVLEAYRILPAGIIPPLSYAIPFLEFFLGFALVLGFSSRKASAAAGGLFLLFIMALASTMLRGIPLENCGCFGGDIHLTPAQAMGLDSFLVCLSYLAYRAGAFFAPLDSWVQGGKT
ncbi:MAG: MauE/DoxX family redox-associated membrane protein [Elusimicrobiota bacterium]